MATRLSDVERAERRITGAELQRLLTDLLELHGYAWCHFRALQNRRGFWQVPVEGPLGEGWPDVFAVGRGGAIAFELKREVADEPTPRQAWVHEQLAAAGIRVFVVRPSDLRDVEQWRGRVLG